MSRECHNYKPQPSLGNKWYNLTNLYDKRDDFDLKLLHVISRSLMAMSLGGPLMECILFVSLRHLLILVTTVVVTKP